MHHRSGFTLIELLIVVAIIGILAAIAVPNFLNAQIRAKVSKCVSEEKALAEACFMYAMDNNMNVMHSDFSNAHNGLTTPTAYHPGPVWDIFKNTVETKSLHGGLIHIEPFEWSAGTAKLLPGVGDSFRGSSAALLMGVGPAHGYGPPYDSSNGVSSVGGIYRLIPKGASGVGREEVRRPS